MYNFTRSESQMELEELTPVCGVGECETAIRVFDLSQLVQGLNTFSSQFRTVWTLSAVTAQ